MLFWSNTISAVVCILYLISNKTANINFLAKPTSILLKLIAIFDLIVTVIGTIWRFNKPGMICTQQRKRMLTVTVEEL